MSAPKQAVLWRTPSRKRTVKQSNRGELDENNNVFIPAKKIRKLMIHKPREVRGKHNEIQSRNAGRVPWNSLPPEVFAKIFTYVVYSEESALPCLQRISKVCSYWNEVSRIPTLWSCLRFSLAVVGNEEKFKRNLVSFNTLASRCFKFVESLQVNGLMKSTANIVDVVARHAKALQEVSLFQAGRISLKSCLKVLASNHGSTVKEFSLLYTDFGSLDLATTINAFGNALRKLVLLNSEMPRQLRVNFGQFKNLEVLKVDCGNQFEISRLRGLDKLRVLHIIGMFINTSGVMEVELPHLEDVNFSVSKELSRRISMHESSMLLHLLNCSENLQRIDLRYRMICVRTLVQRTKHSKNLQHLDISLSYASGLAGIIIFASYTLEELYLDECRLLNEEVLEMYCTLGIWDSLRVLSMERSDILLTTISVFLQYFTKLERLNLKGCRELPRGMKREWTDMRALRSAIDSLS